MTPLRAEARVLVITTARIGDTLLTTPAIRACRQAAAAGRVEVLAHPERAALLEHLPFIDRLGTITKRRAPWRGRLAPRVFDLALVYGRDAALVRYALRRAERAVAFDHPELAGCGDRLQRVAVPPDASMHAVAERLLLAQAAGADTQDRRLAYAVTPAERERAAHLLQTRLGAGRPAIGLQMQSFATKAHRDWPTGHFAALATRIAARWPQARFALLGDRAGAPAARRVAQSIGECACDLTGALALREAAALIGQLDLYVGVDTGPTHIAGALGVPMVALYHWAYPGRNLAPLAHPRCRVVEHPDTGRGAPAAARDMSAITVERVWQAVEPLLEAGAPRA